MYSTAPPTDPECPLQQQQRVDDGAAAVPRQCSPLQGAVGPLQDHAQKGPAADLRNGQPAALHRAQKGLELVGHQCVRFFFDTENTGHFMESFVVFFVAHRFAQRRAEAGGDGRGRHVHPALRDGHLARPVRLGGDYFASCIFVMNREMIVFGHFFVEVIIKRQHNVIRVCGLVRRGIPSRRMYFLIGYCEELLSYWLQCPVQLELQTVEQKQDVIFKYI